MHSGTTGPVEPSVPGGPAPKPQAFYVDKILDHRRENDGFRYLVLWYGHPRSSATWEPVSSFDDIECIDSYWRGLPMSARSK